MLITLEPHGIFPSNFVHLCILTLSSHANRWRGFVEHHFGRSSYFSENAHNSWTPWYILFKFCILVLNIVRPLPCKTVTRLCRASFWPVNLIIMVNLIIIYQLRVVQITVSWFINLLICLLFIYSHLISIEMSSYYECTYTPLVLFLFFPLFDQISLSHFDLILTKF